MTAVPELWSWNRIPHMHAAEVIDLQRRDLVLPERSSMLVFGNGRSYGDVCLNGGATSLRTRNLNRFISFDRASGRIICESGILFKDILDVVVSAGWFLPVTPGTKFVTVGGAVANDVHGKNHHKQGTFGNHIASLELLSSDGTRRVCSDTVNADWFQATIGGLGLTGLITWVELQLLPIKSAFMETEHIRFPNLEAYWELNTHKEKLWDYTVAWIDCLATGAKKGRGILSCSRHADAGPSAFLKLGAVRQFPFEPPFSLVNAVTVKLFNEIYYNRPLRTGVSVKHYYPTFYPLDGVRDWYRVYGSRGFYQYQCVLPPERARAGINALLDIIAQHRAGSFLVVLKSFGALPSKGLLSFGRPGSTLAIDFANQGERTLKLMNQLDQIVRNAGGALYPAKDARMSPDMFQASFPAINKFKTFIDAKFSSSFWRRVAG